MSRQTLKCSKSLNCFLVPRWRWGHPVQYALKMYEHIERLDQLGYWMDFELSLNLILARLPNGFA